MGGSKACKGKDGIEINRVIVDIDLDKDIRSVTLEYDYYDPTNWADESQTESRWQKKLVIKAVSKNKKYIVKVKIGEVETEMFTDGGSDASVVPASFYRREMGKLHRATERLWGVTTSKCKSKVLCQHNNPERSNNKGLDIRGRRRGRPPTFTWRHRSFRTRLYHISA